MKKEIDNKTLIELLESNEINNYELMNDKKELRIKELKSFDRFIFKYQLSAFRTNQGYYAPYGWNDEVFAEYQGWKITSSLKYTK
jgi:hypothetical protein